MPESELQRIELEIYGLAFRLRAPIEEHDRLLRTAKYVDTVMREQVSAQSGVDTTRLAIQSAFIIAKEYFQAMDEAVEGNDALGGREMSRRVEGLVSTLDNTLAELEAEFASLAVPGQEVPFPGVRAASAALSRKKSKTPDPNSQQTSLELANGAEPPDEEDQD